LKSGKPRFAGFFVFSIAISVTATNRVRAICIESARRKPDSSGPLQSDSNSFFAFAHGINGLVLSRCIA